jgi:MFS family permease
VQVVLLEAHMPALDAPECVPEQRRTLLQVLDACRRTVLRGRAIFVLFTAINAFTFLDRGIIPGSSVEILQFIRSTLHTREPDVYLGLLQSAFIVGFACSSLIFAHLTHYCNTFKLMGTGLSIWALAVLLSGCAGRANSYWFLFAARLLSGVGEARLVLHAFTRC